MEPQAELVAAGWAWARRHLCGLAAIWVGVSGWRGFRSGSNQIYFRPSPPGHTHHMLSPDGIRRLHPLCGTRFVPPLHSPESQGILASRDLTRESG